MHSLALRHVQFVVTILMLSLTVWAPNSYSGQTDELTGVDGNSYLSPTYEYSLFWDESIWAPTSASSANGTDSLILTSSGTNLYIDGLYFYQGDAVGCVNGEAARIAEEQEVAEPTLLVDSDGAPRVAPGDGWAQAFIGMPDAAQPDQFTMVVYIECRTVVPNSVVMILTAYMDPADAAAQEVAVLDVVSTIQMSDIGLDQMDLVDLEAHIGSVMEDLDGYWTAVFADLGAAYSLPNYDFYTAPMEFQCGQFLDEHWGQFYCWEGEIVYLESNDLTLLYLPYGLSVVDWVVAHEVGHHIQILLGLSGCMANGCGPETDSKSIELQADCLGAAWMQDAAARGYYDERDIERIEAGLKSFLGDPPDEVSDSTDAHGTGDERFDAFLAGYQDGIVACGIE